MNTVSKVLIVYCCLAAVLIIASLFLGNNRSVLIYLILVPLPVYFGLYAWKDLSSPDTNIGLSSTRIQIFVILFVGLLLLGIYKLTTNPQQLVNDESVVLSPTVTPIVTAGPASMETPMTLLIKIQAIDSGKPVDIYEDADIDSKVVGEAKDNDIFVADLHQSGWYKVNFENSHKGYIQDSEAIELK